MSDGRFLPVLAAAQGGVSGGANLCPQVYVELYHARSRGEMARAAERRLIQNCLAKLALPLETRPSAKRS